MLINTGISFGLFENFPTWISAIIIGCLLVYAVKMRELWERVGLGLIILGGLGNLVQRYLYGGVVDNLNFFGVLQNNVWDYLIVGGLCVYVYHLVGHKVGHKVGHTS